MILPQDFVIRWTGSPLVRARPEDIISLHIPDCSKQFLVEAGLPRNPFDLLRFESIAMGVFPLPEKWPYYQEATDQYRVLGTWGDWNCFFCMDEAYNGEVVQVVETRQRLQVNFVNSSVPQLAESLLIYSELAASILGDPQYIQEAEEGEFYLPDGTVVTKVVSVEGSKVFFEALEKALKKIDHRAVEDEDCFWSGALLMY